MTSIKGTNCMKKIHICQSGTHGGITADTWREMGTVFWWNVVLSQLILIIFKNKFAIFLIWCSPISAPYKISSWNPKVNLMFPRTATNAVSIASVDNKLFFKSSRLKCASIVNNSCWQPGIGLTPSLRRSAIDSGCCLLIEDVWFTFGWWPFISYRRHIDLKLRYYNLQKSIRLYYLVNKLHWEVQLTNYFVLFFEKSNVLNVIKEKCKQPH